MRKVFTSMRVENVEAVAALLRAEGIEVQITNGRSYRGNRRGNFSYRARENAPEQAAVWIVRAEDQPRGRQLLREAGLLDSSREGASSYLPNVDVPGIRATGRGGMDARMRLKLGLLLLIAVVIGLAVFAGRRYLPKDDAPAAAQAPASNAAPLLVPAMVDAPEAYRVDVPTALATALVAEALSGKPATQACVSVDGGDPSPSVLAAVRAGNTRLFAQSACPDTGAVRIAIRDYLTDGSGSGTVQLHVGDGAAQTFEASRIERDWQLRKSR